MTFTEAAVQVLRLVGKPLHYKEITDVAIEKELLSHVGKSPEVTMGARLAAVVKKGGKESQLARVKPGVFALSDWDEKTIEDGLQDRVPALKKIAQNEAKVELAADEATEPPAESEVSLPAPPEPSSVSCPVPQPLEAEGTIGEDEKARAELTAAATEIFEAEADDDEPIFGVDTDETEDDDEGDNGNRRRRGRGRGRSRGRSRDRDDDDDLPGYTVSDASTDVAPDAAGESTERSGESPRGRGRRGRDRGERDRERNDRDADRHRERVPGDDATGVDLASTVEQLLTGGRRTGPLSPRQLAESARKDKSGEAASPQAIAAACRTDNWRREQGHERPRFRFTENGRIALVEWSLDKELLRLERDAIAAVSKYRDAALRNLARRIGDLPSRVSGELYVLLLERLGYSNVKTITRAGAHPAELHLSAVLRSAGGELPVAVVVRKDGRDVGRERVTDLRGALHHYGHAAAGLLVTTGQILSGAREEASVAGATPISFVDGQRLAELCEQSRLGVVNHYLTLTSPDLDFFEAFRSS